MAAAPFEIEVEIDAGKFDRSNVPVRVPIKLTIDPASVKLATVRDGARPFAAQVTKPSLLNNDDNANAELHFILPAQGSTGPAIRAGQKRVFQARIVTEDNGTSGFPHFQWTDLPGKQADLSLGERPVLRYMYEKLDTSSKSRQEATIKPYHHVFDPQGDAIITKGPGGLYTHHRGLFFGFNKITYDGGKPADVWHCHNGESQQHVQFLAQEAGPILGRHRVKIEWRGRQNDVFAVEEREITAYNTQGGTLIEFASRVNTTDGEVKLDGDPQHAGFHFRASNEVADQTKDDTYYLRPDGRDKPGATRNWPGHKQHVNLPWNAMSFVLGGNRFTALYLDKPSNPKEARFSERDYGRFGSYFEYTLAKDKPLAVNYRVWVQRGELTGEEARRRDDNFDNPVQVSLK